MIIQNEYCDGKGTSNVLDFKKRTVLIQWFSWVYYQNTGDKLPCKVYKFKSHLWVV